MSRAPHYRAQADFARRLAEPSSRIWSANYAPFQKNWTISQTKLMRKLLRKQGFAPKLLVTDKLRSYASAFRRLRLSCRHEQGLRSNNRAENSHQPVRRSRAQDAAVQIGSIRSALPQHARRRSQHLQPSTPSRLAVDTADLPSRGDERMAECSRGSVIARPASGFF